MLLFSRCRLSVQGIFDFETVQQRTEVYDVLCCSVVVVMIFADLFGLLDGRCFGGVSLFLVSVSVFTAYWIVIFAPEIKLRHIFHRIRWLLG